MPGLATSLEGLAVLAQSSGELEEAARLFAAADVVRRDFRCPLPPTEFRDRNLRLAALSNALGKATFDAIWRAGMLMSTADAVSCAVGDQADS